MFTDADGELTGLERRLLEAIEREFDRWGSHENAPLPLALVQAIDKAHRMILGRLGKRMGHDFKRIMENPSVEIPRALVQLDRTKAALMKLAEQHTNIGTIQSRKLGA